MFSNIIAAGALHVLCMFMNSLGQVSIPPKLSSASWGLSVCLTLSFILYSWNHPTPIKRLKQTLTISVLGLACLKSMTLFLWPQTSPPDPHLVLSLNNMIAYWPLVLTQTVYEFLTQLLPCLVTITVFMNKQPRIHAFWIIPAYKILTGNASVSVAWAQRLGLLSDVYLPRIYTSYTFMLIGLTLAVVMITWKFIHELGHAQETQSISPHKKLRELMRAAHTRKAIAVFTTMDIYLSSWQMLTNLLLYRPLLPKLGSSYAHFIEMYQQSMQWFLLVVLPALMIGLALAFIVLYRKTQSETQRLKTFTHFILSLIIVNISMGILYTLFNTHAPELTTQLISIQSLAAIRSIISLLTIPVAFYFVLPETSYSQCVASYFVVWYGQMMMIRLFKIVSFAVTLILYLLNTKLTNQPPDFDTIQLIESIVFSLLGIYLFYLSCKQRKPINLPA